MRPQFKSNASVFEDMGNPWVSEKEGLAVRGEEKTVLSALSKRHREVVLINNRMNTRLGKLGLSTAPQKPFLRASKEVFPEDPEIDQFTRASIARKHFDMGPMKGTTSKATPARRASSIALALRLKLMALEGRK